ncbi:MAG TPA: glycosyltransferase [Chloroflexia bacterium]|nr:glycosyltransferase [Chloroflexia bacterium]
MKVLVLPAWYPTARYPVGGIFCPEQARALQSRPGVEARVLFVDRVPPRQWRRTRGQELRPIDEAGVQVYRVPMPRLRAIWPLLYAAWTVWAIRRLIHTEHFRPDVLHAHVSLPAGLAGGLVKRLFGIPLVLTEHTSPFSLLMRNRLATAATRAAIHAADRVIAVSPALEAEIRAYPALRRPITIVPNVVDVDAFSALAVAGEAHRLLFVGEMETERKGVPYLLAALALLRGRSLDVCLDLVGGGRRRAEYEERAVALGVASSCRFHGSLPHHEVAALMTRAGLFVLPSLQETFGVVLAEALAAGLPLVATRSGGPEEIVTPDVGVLVPPADAAALADGIAGVLTRRADFPAAHLRAVATERYGQAAVAGRLIDLYTEVVARR